MPFGSLWGKRESELPEELRSLTPEQLVEQLNAGKAAKTALDAQAVALTTLQTEAAKVPMLENSFTQLQARLNALEANAPRKETATTEVVPSVLENEDGAFNARLQPIFMQQLNQGAQMARTLALMALNANSRSRYVVAKYGTEIDRLFATVPLAQRTQEASYHNCYKIVHSDHAEEIELEKAKTSGAFNLEGGGNGGQQAPNTGAPRVDVLNDDEKRSAKKMGVSEEDYLKTKKGMVFANA